MGTYVKTEKLSVGYHGNILIPDINLELEQGKILTLIGPNGSGKSTILKTMTRQLERIQGAVWIGKQELSAWSAKEMAKQMAVVLTDRIRPELMTCAEVAAMGRYPYTGWFGRLTSEDEAAVREALLRVHALELAEQEFSTLSDGQRQRILLARALCQEPKLLILDEPTAYLDIRYKLELLDILREMAHEKGITVILSLHEIDLAMKLSDLLLCVKDGQIKAFGEPEQILKASLIEELYDLPVGAYNHLFGSVELSKTPGKPQIFVIAGGGYGIPCYRMLQKKEIPFATGILFANDVDAQVASELSEAVVLAPAFEEMEEEHYKKAAALLCQCEAVLDAGTPIGRLNRQNQRLLLLAEENGIPVYQSTELDLFLEERKKSDGV